MGFGATVLAGLVVAAATAFIPGLWGWLSDQIASIAAHLGEGVSIPRWAIYTLATPGLFFFVIGLASAFKRARSRLNPDHWRNYTRDSFKGVAWEWSYAGNNVAGLSCYCPECRTELVHESTGGDYMSSSQVYLHCERCDRCLASEIGTYTDLRSAVQRLVERNIRTGEYPRPSGGSKDDSKT